MTHAQRINKDIRKAGFVWHACDGCGRDWPFPMGIPPEDNQQAHEMREWFCHVCLTAEAAAIQRGAPALLRRFLDNHCANADAEGMSVLCECTLCVDTRVFLAV